jgi:hypothetical protein
MNEKQMVKAEGLLDKALVSALEMTHAWYEERLKMGIPVSEKQLSEKALSIYNKMILNTKLDVLNF